jgi:hypothetical protein
MLNGMRQRLGPTTRFLLGLAGILALLIIVGGFWWLVPAWPQAKCTTPVPCWDMLISEGGHTILTVHSDALILWDASSGLERHRLKIDNSTAKMIGMSPVSALLAPDGQTVAFSENLRPTIEREFK